MNTPNHCAATAAPLPRLPATLGDAMRVLRALALRIDEWRVARKRAAEDREALANMSDRDLLDIGIARSSVNAVADGKWMRDYPQ